MIPLDYDTDTNIKQFSALNILKKLLLFPVHVFIHLIAVYLVTIIAVVLSFISTANEINGDLADKQIIQIWLLTLAWAAFVVYLLHRTLKLISSMLNGKNRFLVYLNYVLVNCMYLAAVSAAISAPVMIMLTVLAVD